MGKKIIRLTETDLTKIVKKVISEQTTLLDYNKKMAIQCFLNKKGIKDDRNQSLEMDGKIGNYPGSKTAQAILKYQRSLGVAADGTWGNNTITKMPPKDKMIYKQCISDHGDIIDKGMHWLGLD
jgi:peptidoglycan hydrolase-like protein with peptidoglycan-binding domain